MEVSKHIAKKGDFPQCTFTDKDNILVDKTQDGNVQIGKVVGNDDVLLFLLDELFVFIFYFYKNEGKENGRPQSVQSSAVFLQSRYMNCYREKRQEHNKGQCKNEEPVGGIDSSKNNHSVSLFGRSTYFLHFNRSAFGADHFNFFATIDKLPTRIGIVYFLVNHDFATGHQAGMGYTFFTQQIAAIKRRRVSVRPLLRIRQGESAESPPLVDFWRQEKEQHQGNHRRKQNSKYGNKEVAGRNKGKIKNIVGQHPQGQ